MRVERRRLSIRPHGSATVPMPGARSRRGFRRERTTLAPWSLNSRPRCGLSSTSTRRGPTRPQKSSCRPMENHFEPGHCPPLLRLLTRTVRDVDYRTRVCWRHGETGRAICSRHLSSGVAGYAWLAGGGLMVEAVKGSEAFRQTRRRKICTPQGRVRRMRHPLQSGDLVGLRQRVWAQLCEAAAQFSDGRTASCSASEVVLPSPSPANVTSAPAAEEPSVATHSSPAKLGSG